MKTAGKMIANGILNIVETVVDRTGETYLNIFNSGIIIDLKKASKTALRIAKNSVKERKGKGKR